MILTLRRAHRATFVVLAAGLPLLFVTGLRVRTQPPTMPQLPASLVGEQEAFEGDWNHADALLYWAPQSADVGDGLPQGARLLGSVREGMSSGPSNTSSELPTSGFFVVYSLATQQVVDSFPSSLEGAQ